MNLRPALSQVRAIPSGTLAVKGLNKSYQLEDRRLPVLENIDLNIPSGEFVSIVGPSGCGKSTFLRLVMGLDAHFEGEIVVDGKRISGTSLDRGIVFQDHRLFPWMTVEDNVALALLRRDLGKAEKKELVAAHLRLVNLEGFEKAYPHQLSGGMAQRAAIARALVNEPKILLLDEPLGALDALTRLKVRTELERIWLKHRSTVIMVTHDVAEAVYLSSRVVVMDSKPGRIKSIVPVPLDYPRERSSAALKRIEEQILGDIMIEDRPPSKGADRARAT